MPERRSGLHVALSHPWVYRLFKQIIGDSNKRDAWLVGEQIRARPGDRVLDIGCGPGHLLEQLPNVQYVGFDLSEAYVEAAQRTYGGRGRFFHASVTDPPPVEFGTFDIVVAKGVFHHLDDQEARSMLTLAHKALRPGGRLITFDGCFVDGQSWIARFLLRRDRGLYVRSEEKYARLADRVFGQVESFVRHDLLRVPYSHLVLQCTRNDEPDLEVTASEGLHVQLPGGMSHHD